MVRKMPWRGEWSGSSLLALTLIGVKIYLKTRVLQTMMSKKVVQIILVFMVVLFLLPLFAMQGSTAEAVDGAQLFEANCAGCHANGGNIVRWGKNLKQRAMAKNGYTSIETIADLVTHGKGNMSAYGDRLTAPEIQAVSEYVLQQSQKNWKS